MTERDAGVVSGRGHRRGVRRFHDAHSRADGRARDADRRPERRHHVRTRPGNRGGDRHPGRRDPPPRTLIGSAPIESGVIRLPLFDVVEHRAVDPGPRVHRGAAVRVDGDAIPRPVLDAIHR